MSNTISPQDLRIGNYFKYLHSKEYLTVSTINSTGVTCHECMDHFYFKEIEPIPLTEEILVKAKFDWSIQHQAYKNPESKWVVYEGYVYQNIRGGFFIRKIEYLHELQNLIFSIEGRELEIKL